MTYIYYTEAEARRLMESLKKQGYETVELWTGLDAFGQHYFEVKWW